MAGQITPTGDRFKVTCAGGCSRPLSWNVETREHAENLLRKHDREHHPDQPAVVPDPGPASLAPETPVPPLDATAAARAVLDLDHAAATAVWVALTGLAPADARTLAVSLAEHDGTITAHVAPF
jgi:hypothetical protein